MDKKSLRPKQKAPVVRPTTITPPQLSEEQLTSGIMAGGEQGIHPLSKACTCSEACGCSFDGDDAE